MGQPTVPVPPSLGGPEVVNRAMGSPKGRVDDPRTSDSLLRPPPCRPPRCRDSPSRTQVERLPYIPVRLEVSVAAKVLIIWPEIPPKTLS